VETQESARSVPPRMELQMKFTWFIKRFDEDEQRWMSRIIAEADITETAKVILHLRNTRYKMLKDKGINAKQVLFLL
jgi:hypothetical protein